MFGCFRRLRREIFDFTELAERVEYGNYVLRARAAANRWPQRVEMRYFSQDLFRAPMCLCVLCANLCVCILHIVYYIYIYIYIERERDTNDYVYTYIYIYIYIYIHTYTYIGCISQCTRPRSWRSACAIPPNRNKLSMLALSSAVTVQALSLVNSSRSISSSNSSRVGSLLAVIYAFTVNNKTANC